MKRFVSHMNSISRQRGFLLVTAVVLIIIVSLILTVMVFLGATGTDSSVVHSQSGQALFAAESGMERALRGFSKEGTACANLTYNSTLSAGATTVAFATAGTVNAPASTTLSANINATTAIIPATSITGYASHGRITIDAERIQYQGTSTSAVVCGTAPCFTGTVRGVAGTPAASHNINAVIRQNQCVIRATGTSGNTTRAIERATTISDGTDAMMAYAKDSPAASVGIPFFRIWDNTTSSWSAEQSATSVGAGRIIQYVVLKSARTRNEVILGTQDSTGDIRVQVWNGTVWSATSFVVNVGSDTTYRGFDIEYETNGDRAVLVYNNGANSNLNYWIWNGSAWSAQPSVAMPIAGRPRWVELAPHPDPASNEIVMLVLSSSSEIYGMRWGGSAWSNMGIALSWDVAVITSRKIIDVAYEQQSGRAMFVWGTAAAAGFKYRFWNGAALTATQNFIFTSSVLAGTSNWVRVAPNLFSNEIMYGVQDSARDLHTAYWNGASWIEGPRHDSNVENAASRNFDLVFDTNPARAGDAWLVWGSRISTDFARRRQWTGGAWSGTITNFADDVALTQLAAHPNSGWLFAGLYGDSTGTARNLVEYHYNGGAWTQTSIWGGPVIADPVQERVYLSPTRFGLGIYDWVEIFP